MTRRCVFCAATGVHECPGGTAIPGPDYDRFDADEARTAFFAFRMPLSELRVFPGKVDADAYYEGRYTYAGTWRRP